MALEGKEFVVTIVIPIPFSPCCGLCIIIVYVLIAQLVKM